MRTGLTLVLLPTLALIACAQGPPMTKAEYEAAARASLGNMQRDGEAMANNIDYPDKRAELLAAAKRQRQYWVEISRLRPPSEFEPVHDALVEGNLSLWESNVRCLSGPDDGCAGRETVEDNPDLYVPDDPLAVPRAKLGFGCVAAFDYDLGYDSTASGSGGLTEEECARMLSPGGLAEMRANVERAGD